MVMGPMSIFPGFRRLVAALQALTDVLAGLARIQQELGPALDRLNALELSRHHFEAECEGMLLRADGRLKAANSSEQRERQLKKANARHVDPFASDGEEVAEPVLANDAPAGEAQRLPPVHLGVENGKSRALRAKWGL